MCPSSSGKREGMGALVNPCHLEKVELKRVENSTETVVVSPRKAGFLPAGRLAIPTYYSHLK
jgi:hypothetical protein